MNAIENRHMYLVKIFIYSLFILVMLLFLEWLIIFI